MTDAKAKLSIFDKDVISLLPWEGRLHGCGPKTVRAHG